MRFLFAGSLALFVVAAAPPALALDACKGEKIYLNRLTKRVELDTRYPPGKEEDLGEGWVQLHFTVTPEGRAEDVSVTDAIGSIQFVVASRESILQSKWEPAVRLGAPVAMHQRFEFEYRMRGENRAGVHNIATRNYDIAYANRRNGNYKQSVEVLLRTLELTLNLYEYTTTSYGLALSYLGLGDKRRALRHIRHAVIGEATNIDRGVRRSALALAAELSAQDNSFRESLCFFDTLKRNFPDFVPSAQQQAEIERATRELSTATPIRTEVELIESAREDVAPMWRHAILRGTLTFSGVQGAITRARVSCPVSQIDFAFPLKSSIDVDRSVGPCVLFVFGEPGARFVLEER